MKFRHVGLPEIGAAAAFLTAAVGIIVSMPWLSLFPLVILYGFFIFERHIAPSGRAVGQVLNVATGVRAGTRADLASERRIKLQELSRVYATNMTEDWQNGTEFDNAIFDAINNLKKQFCERQEDGFFPTSPLLTSYVDPDGGIDES